VSSLASLSAFDGLAIPGRYGSDTDAPGARLTELKNLGLASLEIRKGQGESLKAAMRDAYGVDLPERSTVARGEAVSFIGTGPGQWFAVSETLQNEALAEALAETLTGLASIADHSSGRAVLRIEGPRARDVLAKGLPLDLDPRVFPQDGAAVSTISHMGVLIWRSGTDSFDIALFRSAAGSFWTWVTESAAAYGYEIV
jgi:heterotetrameric sarcosine oxidase gamma subunit